MPINPIPPSIFDGTTSSAGSGSTEGPPLECRIPVDSGVKLPPRLAIINGRLVAVPAEESRESYPPEQIVARIMTDGSTVMLKSGYGYKLPMWLSEVHSLAAVKAALQDQMGPMRMPNNAKQVAPAGAAMLNVMRTYPEAAVMKIDTVRMQSNLDRVAFLTQLRESPQSFLNLIDNNLAHTLNEISEDVRGGISRLGGALEFSVRMKTELESAIALISGPAEEAQKTKAKNERLVAKTMATVEAKNPPAPAATPPATPAPPDNKK